MRTLNLHEAQTVNGAGYAQDITAAAATLFVGGCISSVGAGIGAVVTMPLGLMSGLAPLAGLSFFGPAIGALALPAFVASTVLSANPELRSDLENKFHQYFG